MGVLRCGRCGASREPCTRDDPCERRPSIQEARERARARLESLREKRKTGGTFTRAADGRAYKDALGLLRREEKIDTEELRLRIEYGW